MDKPNVNNGIDSTQALSLAEPLTPIADLGVLSGEAADKNIQALLATPLDSTPISQPGNISTFKPSDVYSFSVAEDGFDVFNNPNKSNINLSLRDISAGDDADVSLYRDSNNNGVLDLTSDELITSSQRALNNDDLINVRTDAGDYFAKVDRWSAGSSGDVQYQLDLSAAKPSNLLPEEFSNVPLNFVQDNDSDIRTFTGSINAQNTSDVYRFSLANSGADSAQIYLTGLSADADVRVIHDFNQNQLLEPGSGFDRELFRSSTNSGSSNEDIFHYPGGSRSPYTSDFVVQVYQYSGDTDYTLTVEPAFST
jgi:hypothetical protein